jgi:hypothetical protein
MKSVAVEGSTGVRWCRPNSGLIRSEGAVRGPVEVYDPSRVVVIAATQISETGIKALVR